MASDVSDEALEKLVEELLYGFRAGRLSHGELLAFAKRIRDMTLHASRAACTSMLRTPEWQEHNDAVLDCREAIRQLFPGAAAAEGEVGDGKG